MGYGVRAIVGAWLLSACLCGAAKAQSFGGWLPFRDDEKETFVTPPTSLGASTATRPTPGAIADSAPTARTTSPNLTPPALPSQAASGGTAPPTTAMAPDSRTSFFPSFAWPEFQMPYFPKPRLPFLPEKQDVEQARNAWVQPNPEPAAPSPWQAVTTGAARVKASTANAWHKTVDLLTPGRDEDERTPTRVAQREPSLWSRMFSTESTERQGPQTVPEWMAQERINP
jgi:hypothetical protein